MKPADFLLRHETGLARHEYVKDFSWKAPSPAMDCLTRHVSRHKLLHLQSRGYYLDWYSIGDPYTFADNADVRLQKCVVRMLLHAIGVQDQLLRKSKVVTITVVHFDRTSMYMARFEFRRPQLRGPTSQRFAKPFDCVEDVVPNPRDISLSLRLNIFVRDKYTCQYCGWINGMAGTPDRVLHIDHVVSVFHGGTNKPDNLVTACHKCNLSKNRRIVSQYWHGARNHESR